jgi:hypothetical protein
LYFTTQAYGDIILPLNPTSYEEAIAAFKILPTVMGTPENNYELSAPIRMQLTPITEVSRVI